jgi:hypothetical protein
VFEAACDPELRWVYWRIEGATQLAQFMADFKKANA